MLLTYRYRIKDATAGKRLDAKARAVNFVWNFCGETQKSAAKWSKRWPSHYDLMKLTSGSSKELGILATTINDVCRVFARSRDAAKHRPRWRGQKSLGWIPLHDGEAIRLKGDRATFMGKDYKLWYSRPIGGVIKCGSFSQDSRRRWYLNLQCEVRQIDSAASGSIGIDLGLKDLAVLSDGTKVENPRYFAKHEGLLAKAQRTRQKKRARAIASKIGRARQHFLHEQSTRIARQYQTVVVGNVNASGLAQVMGKSVFDASWSTFRAMLRYKLAMRRGAEYVEASERFTTQTCSACGSRSGPQGRKALGIRQWVCAACGVVHDRDHNAAINILAGAERRPLAEGIPAS